MFDCSMLAKTKFKIAVLNNLADILTEFSEITVSSLQNAMQNPQPRGENNLGAEVKLLEFTRQGEIQMLFKMSYDIQKTCKFTTSLLNFPKFCYDWEGQHIKKTAITRTVVAVMSLFSNTVAVT